MILSTATVDEEGGGFVEVAVVDVGAVDVLVRAARPAPPPQDAIRHAVMASIPLAEVRHRTNASLAQGILNVPILHPKPAQSPAR